MSEEQINGKSDNYQTSKLGTYATKEFIKCVIERTIVSKTEENDEELITLSMFMGLMGTVMIKIGSELSEISAAIMKKRLVKHDDLIRKLAAPNQEFVNININNPDILKLVSNQVDPINIVKYLSSVMEQCFLDEISKWIRVRKTELNNGVCEEYIPISIIEGLIGTWVDTFSSEALEAVENMLRKLEYSYIDNLDLKTDALKEDYHTIVRQRNDMIKQLANLKKEAKLTQNYDILTKLDNIKIPKMSKIQQMYFKDAEDYEELMDSYNKKTPSIICSFPSRNKKLEIISARKQLKGKERYPLPEVAL